MGQGRVSWWTWFTVATSWSPIPPLHTRKIEVLLQIPAGAISVAAGQATRSVHMDLPPYHTQTLEYYYYFPRAGKFSHYPVQVADAKQVLAFGTPLVLNVVRELANVDKESWDYVSQHGSPDDVIEFLKSRNLLRVDLGRIAWRMQDAEFFARTIAVLNARHVYNHVLWSYAVLHTDVPGIRQFLQFAPEFVQQSGPYLDSPLLTNDPIVRGAYEQMDYRPLVNARVGKLGRNRTILNNRFLEQYHRLLTILSHRRQLNDIQWLTVTYYLLLQDRVEDATDAFARVDADRLETRLQYDYFTAYLNFYKSEPEAARRIAARYADYPVERWRLAFANIVNQADEIAKPDVRVADPEDRNQVQARAAAETPTFEFAVEGKRVHLQYRNLKTVEVHYYPMDIELLFSRSPFVQGDSRQFSQIIPNRTQVVELPAGGSEFEFALPAELTASNVLIEILGAGVTHSQVYYSNALKVDLVENYGQLNVSGGDPAHPLPKVYVKAYARMKNGEIRFYKDGYTDLRGRFDYASLSTNELDFVDRFSLLILSDEHGAVVREAQPPKR